VTETRGDPLPAAAEPFDLTGRVALVTGGSSGLGERFARVLAGAGAKVAIAARRVDRIEALAKELPDAVALPCDVTVDEECTALVDSVVAHFGRIDVLINNAGASSVKPALKEDPADLRRILGLNVVAPFVLSQAAAGHMRHSGGGTIVNVASIFGLRGAGTMPQASYATSKGALVNMTRELAAQWARHGIRVNALAPGFFHSEMTDGLWEADALVEWLTSKTPLGREADIEEFDSALLFLVGPGSSYVTGQIVAVDGGWTAT
jgi:NAD(P)-dependent dehydrogenase (short-subunit alcohol dehydrogenase family)